METLMGIISMAMSLYCYAYCGTDKADTSPLEKTQIVQGEKNGNEKLQN